MLRFYTFFGYFIGFLDYVWAECRKRQISISFLMKSAMVACWQSTRCKTARAQGMAVTGNMNKNAAFPRAQQGRFRHPASPSFISYYKNCMA
ncbi:MAG: hypothetical protein LBM74_04990 [Oscillospiraceae bacterium]|jgi:hypothetical protein|nr:hypothetical protein [Oscillospiraceae bacterium]